MAEPINPLPKNSKTWAAGVGAACMLICLPFTAQHEGEKLRSYLDPVGVWTICNGETLDVKPGQVKTAAECHSMLEMRLGYFAWNVDQMIKVPVKPSTEAALASFAYNVGLDNFKNSTLLKKINSGDIIGGCNELPRWNRAKGRILPGLTARRLAEQQLCIAGTL